MVSAEAAGKITIGRWAKRFGVSAAAAVEVMSPTEAHHTGTGWRGKSRLTPVIDSDSTPTDAQVAAMKAFDESAKAAKSAPPRIVENCVVRYVTWPTTRYARRKPTEHVEAVAAVELFATGAIACVAKSGKRTTHWHKLSGLVIAKDGKIVGHCNVNRAYDEPDEIAKTICQRKLV
ncbi:MAG: hypothetical protein WC378_20900 [Opitutaceae bacterium]